MNLDIPVYFVDRRFGKLARSIHTITDSRDIGAGEVKWLFPLREHPSPNENTMMVGISVLESVSGLDVIEGKDAEELKRIDDLIRALHLKRIKTVQNATERRPATNDDFHPMNEEVPKELYPENVSAPDISGWIHIDDLDKHVERLKAEGWVLIPRSKVP